MTCAWLAWMVLWMAAPALLPAADSLPEQPTPGQVRHHIESLSPTEKQALEEKKQRFEDLSPEQREKILQLHRQLRSSENAAELREVLQRYTQWLQTLPSRERAELLALPSRERLEKIQQLKRQEQERRFREIAQQAIQPNDAKVIFDWMDDYLTRNESRLIGMLSEPERRHYQGARNIHERRMILFRSLGQSGNVDELFKFDSNDIEQLASRLSPEAAGQLRAAKDDPKKTAALIGGWLHAAWLSRFSPVIDPEKLERFFSEELTSEQRTHLESMPRDQMQAELRQLYLQKMMRQRWQRGGPRGPEGQGRGPDPRGPGSPDFRPGWGPGIGPPGPLGPPGDAADPNRPNNRHRIRPDQQPGSSDSVPPGPQPPNMTPPNPETPNTKPPGPQPSNTTSPDPQPPDTPSRDPKTSNPAPPDSMPPDSQPPTGPSE